MKLSKILLNLPLLFTIPSLVLYPKTSAQALSLPVSNAIEIPSESKELLSYDELLELIDQLTEEELANRFSSEQLARVNGFITSIAKEGVLPDDAEEASSLEEDMMIYFVKMPFC